MFEYIPVTRCQLKLTSKQKKGLGHVTFQTDMIIPESERRMQGECTYRVQTIVNPCYFEAAVRSGILLQYMYAGKNTVMSRQADSAWSTHTNNSATAVMYDRPHQCYPAHDPVWCKKNREYRIMVDCHCSSTCC